MNETLMPGKYYLGDPSDVLPTKILIGIWGNLYNYKNGKFNIHGVDIVIHNTHNGDGKFTDTKNRTYNIETGILALINIELIEDINLCKKNGHIFNFEKEVNFVYDAGIFYVKSGKKYINIDTRNLEEYNSDFEDRCENEEGDHISNTICNGSDNDSITDENNNLFHSDDEDDKDDKDNQINNTENTENKKFNFFKKTKK